MLTGYEVRVGKKMSKGCYFVASIAAWSMDMEDPPSAVAVARHTQPCV
jgi:hypothetical protein